MTTRPLAPPNVTAAPDAASLDASETLVRDRLHERFLELAHGPGGEAACARAGFTALLDREASQCRVSDLAVAVHRLEALVTTERAPLPDLELVDDGDAERNPGFDGVEDEAVAEEEALLALRDQDV